ncbi:AMP-binding protein [Streptomyces sp. NPDC001508]|uniref:AMP-binding protein n=1 Tax=Streptomyces sp. NPDC001508 TaxID=3154656 RepID=UPI00331FB6BC
MGCGSPDATTSPPTPSTPASRPPAPPAAEGPPRLSVDPVCLIYASGTTALPKAVVSTHAQVLFAARAIQQVLRYRAEDVVYSPLPLSFDYGLYQLFLGGLSEALVRLGRPAETGPGLLTRLRDSQATVLPAVPSVAGALARLLQRSNAGLPRLRLLTNTGAAMPKETLDALRGACPRLQVQLMYGLTECKRATVMPVDGDQVRPGSSGLPLPGTDVFVVDDAGRRLPHGAVGEITVRGPHVMAGYWRRPALTAERYVPDAVGMRHGYLKDSPTGLERALRDLRSASLNYSNDRLHLVDGKLALLDPEVRFV